MQVQGQISQMECEAYIKELKPIESLKDVGNEKFLNCLLYFFLVIFICLYILFRWMKQHRVIEMINTQAHYCVSRNIDEFVVQSFISFPEKV